LICIRSTLYEIEDELLDLRSLARNNLDLEGRSGMSVVRKCP